MSVAPKRLVICCDGSWQSSITEKRHVPSNITRLSRSLSLAGTDTNGRDWQQIVYYDGGVASNVHTRVESFWQGTFGEGLNENVLEAYNFLVNNYSAGDEIFCFGFSRGAYTVRALAGVICQIGLLTPNDMSYFYEIYKLWKENSDLVREGRPFLETDAWNEYKKQHEWLNLRTNVKVKVVGVFDTVGSLGVPDIFGHKFSWFNKKYGFHNTSLHPNIENAFQALALDEIRGPFSPAVWYIPESAKVNGKPQTNLLQVWFPGVHINNGGGSGDSLNAQIGDFEQLANIAFAWMVEQVRPFLAFDEATLDYQLKEFKNTMGSGMLGGKEVDYGRRKTTWMQWISEFFVAPPTNEKGYATGNIMKVGGGLVGWATGDKPRTPGEYHLPGDTNEEIHPSITWRMKAKKSSRHPYEPPALRGFERETTANGFVWKKPKPSTVALKEYAIRNNASHKHLERWLMQGGVSKEFQDELDDGNAVPEGERGVVFSRADPINIGEAYAA